LETKKKLTVKISKNKLKVKKKIKFDNHKRKKKKLNQMTNKINKKI